MKYFNNALSAHPQIKTLVFLFCGLGWGITSAVGAAGAERGSNPLSSNTQWEFIATTADEGVVTTGDGIRLLASTGAHERIAVRFSSFHGIVEGECNDIKWQNDGSLQCTVDVWCPDSLFGLPLGHGHRAKIRSSGSHSSMVTDRNAQGEHRIHGVESIPARVDWLRYNTSLGPNL